MSTPLRRALRPKGLGIRLMAVMGAALLPLAVLSYVQTLATTDVAEGRARAAILGETLVAATPLVDIIMQAQGTATTLAASVPAYLDDPAACSEALGRTLSLSAGRYSFIGFVRRDGTLGCSSANAPLDLGQSDWLAARLNDPAPSLSVLRKAPLSGTSVLNLTVPVRTGAEGLIGFLSISMPHSVLEAAVADIGRGGEAPLALMTFDDTGGLLTSTTGLDAAPGTLPRNHPLGSFVGQPGQSFLDRTPDGKRRAFAVVPLSPGGLFVLGSWPADRLADEGFGADLPALTFPLLMWAASLLAAYLAAESQVLRHIGALRRSITAFARGDRSLRAPVLRGAAVELRDVGEAYAKMTEAILHNEADLENVIHQKEVLLREVHHRVKNNLQLIASILNMQLRTAQGTEAREAMKSVQERVLSLATIHRELYQTSGLTDIRAAELLPRILRHTLKIGAAPGAEPRVSVEVADIRLTPDQAVPLALFLTEGMANVLKHGGAQPQVALRLAQAPGGEAVLELENALPRADDAPADEILVEGSDGFGTKLLTAFAHQLEGSIERRQSAQSYLLRLRFRLNALAQAEARQSPVPESDMEA